MQRNFFTLPLSSKKKKKKQKKTAAFVDAFACAVSYVKMENAEVNILNETDRFCVGYSSLKYILLNETTLVGKNIEKISMLHTLTSGRFWFHVKNYK